MRLVGFNYSVETNKIIDLIFYDDEKEMLINQIEDSEDIKSFIDKDHEEISKILDLINRPEPLYYREGSEILNNIEDIICLHIPHNSQGHLAFVDNTEVIDLDNLPVIQMTVNLFDHIKRGPTKFDISKKRSDLYSIKDKDLFTSYEAIDPNPLDINKVLGYQAQALADTKLELMQTKAIIKLLTQELADIKIKLMSK